jgi:uncharacterized membrane protein YoaK (UPF0700 family)
MLFQHPIHESVIFGVLLAAVGGFLDAYTFICRDGVFANAQTGNIVLVGVYAAQGDLRQALIHIPPIAAFVLGVAFVEWTKDTSSKFYMLDWKRIVLIIEIIVLFIVGLLPTSFSNLIVTVIISFVTSVQVSSFRKLVDIPFATTMSTGNLRTASHAAYTAFTKKDRAAAIRAARLFTVIFFFIFGAFLGGLLTFSAGIRSVWCAALMLVFAVVLFNKEEREKGSL